MGIHAICKADGVIHVPAGRAGLTKGATVVVRGI
jgi:hypothetical protein